jgi:hypothetical protein
MCTYLDDEKINVWFIFLLCWCNFFNFIQLHYFYNYRNI